MSSVEFSSHAQAVRDLVRRHRTLLIEFTIFVVLGCLVVGPWMGSGWLLLLDWTTGPNATLTNSAFGLDSGQADAMPIRLGLVALRAVVGPDIASWLPILAFFPVAGLGIGRLVRGSSWRRLAAGLAYTVNPFVFERVRAGHVLLLIGMALLPWAVASFMTARAEGRWFRVRSAAWLAVLVSVSPHLAWIAAVVLLATLVVPGATRRDVVRVALTVLAAVGAAAYGIAVYLAGARTVVVGDADLDAFATRGGTAIGRLVETTTMYGFWRGGTLPRESLGPLWFALLAASTAVAVLGWRAARRTVGANGQTLALVVVVAGAAGIVLATGAHGPIGPLYRSAVAHLPLFAVMREAQKFVMLVVLAWAVLLGFGVEAIARRTAVEHADGGPSSSARLLSGRRLAVLATALPLVMTPTLLFGLGGSVTTSDYPSSWAGAEAAMTAGTDDGQGAVLMLPWHQYQPFDFTGARTVRTPAAAYFSRSVITADGAELPGLQSASTSARSAYLDRVMARGNSLTRLGHLVAPLNVRYVLAITTPAAPTLPAWLDEQTDLTEVLRTDDLVLYENTIVGIGRVGAARTVRSISEYIDMVEAGVIGAEAALLDPTAAPDPGGAVEATADGGVRSASAVRYDVSSGEPGWVVVPAVATGGWRLAENAGRATASGAVAFPVDGNAASVVYRPWYLVRRGYALSALVLMGLFAFGLAEHRRKLIDHPAIVWTGRTATSLAARFRAGVGPAYLGVWLVANVAVTSWFRAGTFVSTGDMGPFIRRGWAPGAWWSWGTNITGAGSATYPMARWFEFFLVDAVHALGGSDTLAQRLFYMVIYPMVALGIAAAVGVFTRNRWAIFAAGSFGVLNGFFITRLPNPLNIISVGSTALMAALGWRVAQGRKMPKFLLGLAILPMSFLAYNPPMLTVALAWTALGVPFVALAVWGRRAAWRMVRWGLAASPWALLMNLFWIVPFAHAFTGGGGATATASTDPTAWAWSQAQNSISNVLTLSANWAWYKPQYLPFTPELDRPMWIWLRFLLPVVVLLAPVLALPQRRRAAWTLVSLVLVFTVLAKGLQPPFSGFNMLLYDKVPGFWLFREPMSKLGQMLLLFDGALIALAVEGGLTRVGSIPRSLRIPARGMLCSAVGVILIWPYPLFTGSVIPDERPSQPPAHVVVPNFWRSTAALIDSDPAPGKVLVLPLDDYYQMPTTWGFSGVDSIAGLLLRHPVLQPKPDGYFGDTPGLASQVDLIERSLLSGDIEAVPPLMHQLGIGWVIVRHDLIVDNPLRTFADSDVLGAALDRVSTVERVQSGSLDLYRLTVPSGSPPVRTTSTPIVVPGGAEAVAATVAGLPAGISVVGDPADASAEAVDPVPDPDAQYAADGVYWPVPAVLEGTPSTTFTVPTGGTFTVDQRARGDVAVAAREVADPTSRSGRSLQLTDPAVVLLDGAPVSDRPSIRIPLPVGAGPLVAVRAGDREVSLDDWLSSSMPANSTAADEGRMLPIGAATPVTAFAAATEQPGLTSWTDVYDCNNYEPRPASELRLGGRWSDTDQGRMVSLTAADHAACITTPVLGATAGDTVQLRLKYRLGEGKRPAVCLLEKRTDGTESCVLDRRLLAETTWNRYELVHTLADDVVSAQVVLYANVGLRLSPPTTSEYRDVQVRLLEDVLSTEVWPADVPARKIDIAAGSHELEVVGGARGSLLADFEQLEDCFRYDDLSTEEAGLAAAVLTDADGDGDGPVYELRAIEHMACLAATLPDYGGHGLYTLSYGYRSVALRKPRVCVYHRGPNICEPMPANGSETEWSSYDRLLRPYLDSVETRLYLYGPRDLAGKEQAIVQYRDVSLVPNATATAVVITRIAPSTAPADPIAWEHTTPASYSVTADSLSEGTVVALVETNAPGWVLTGLPDGNTATKVRLNGHQNAWIIDQDVVGPVDIRLAYPPAFTARKVLKLSMLALLGIPASLVLRRPIGRSADRLRQRLDRFHRTRAWISSRRVNFRRNA